MDDQRAPDIPEELRPMIQLNAAFRVLICPHEQCRKAVQPSAFTRHSHEQHRTTFSARQALQKFIDKLGWKYNSKIVELPLDGSRPQPTIPVDDVFECQLCDAKPHHRPFKSSSRKGMKVHGNEDHKGMRVPDDKLYRRVRVQTWFRGGGEARYWRVEESDDRRRETPVVHGRTEVTEAIHGEGDGAVDDAVDDAVITIARKDESVDTPEDAAAAVVVIDSDDEALVPWVKGAVISEGGSGLSVEVRKEAAAAVIVIDSDDEVLVPRRKGPIQAVEVDSSYESNGDADYIPSSEEVSSDEEGHPSGVETEASDADNSEACRPTAGERTVVATPRPRKRKVQPAFARGIGSDNDTYQPFSPRFDTRSPKRRQRMSPFVDSGVVMAPSSEGKSRPPSSPDDGFVPHSSPPTVGWTIQSQPEEEERLQDASRAADEATHDTEDPESEVPFPAPFTFGGRPPTLEALREHLSTWCQACPSCVSEMEVGRVMHHMEDCWREDTVDIVKTTRVMQRHIEARGGFAGREGCPQCGVPQTICHRWQTRPGGSGWEEAAGQACQYEGRLTAAVITMLMDGCHEGWAVAEEWMSRAGVMPTKRDEVFEWFRGAVWWPDIEMEVARIVRVFHMLAEKNRKAR
jgi:hypothetical protein